MKQRIIITPENGEFNVRLNIEQQEKHLKTSTILTFMFFKNMFIKNMGAGRLNFILNRLKNWKLLKL